jgi:sentrin-specific protease 1
MGEANKSDIAKSTHHVCSAHMLQIIKRHAKELCEKYLSVDSQVHMAKRFFGRLIASTTLQELNKIVRLGHYIFKSKYVDGALLEILDNFSDVIYDFDEARCEKTDETRNGINDSTKTDFENETFKEDDDSPKEVSVGTSMQTYWHHELITMETNKATNGDLNKYFMPKYFEYIFKNYLPNCTLWSGLLLGDVRRYNEAYGTKPNHPYNPAIRNSQVDNNTNAEVENFFKIKKNSSFKGKRHLRLDTFIGENWADNKAIQREFVDGLIQGVGKRNKNLEKIEQLCSSIASNVEDISDNSDVDELSTSHCPEEQWHKPIPNESGSRKKGKYLSPSSKKLHFHHKFSQHPNKSKLPNKNSSTAFDRYEQSVWRDVAVQNKMNFDSIKKKIKSMWNTLDATEGEKVYNENSTKVASQPVVVEQTASRKTQGNGFSKLVMKNDRVCCTCRQSRSVSTIQCSFCQEYFHLDCINFSENLARIGETNYFCTNCIYIQYIPFLNYVLNSTNVHDLSRNDVIATLYDEFSSVNRVLTTAKDSIFKKERVDVDRQVNILYHVTRERGMVNQRSNCWISSVLHCLSSTPLLSFLNKLKTTSHPSSLLNLLAKSLENLRIVPDKKTSSVRLCEGPLAVAQSIGMIPDVRDHKDAREFLNKILEGVASEIFENELEDLNGIFQWKILSLNRCLVPECEKIFGRRVVMWNYPIQIPVTSTPVNLQSLLWSHSNGRFTTEDDEVCKTCSCKPAAHHVELIEDIPNVLTFSINRVEFADTLKRIYTPILCDTTINLRGMTARCFDEADLKCTLLAAILHKGPFVRSGHFVAYVFNTASTAILYDDTIVKEVCSKNLITSPEFMKNVYMCFYFKGVGKTKQSRPIKTPDKDDMDPRAKCILSSDDFLLVKKAWSYQKDILLGTVSTFDLKTLKPSHWLNDSVVNAFLELISDESLSKCSVNVHAFSSYLYTVLRDRRWGSSVLRVALSVDLKDLDLLLFPIHFNKHWQLIACYPKSCLLIFFDSMLTVNQTALGVILGFLEAIFSANSANFQLEKWMILAPDTIPHQRDSSSCGVFACMNAYSLVCDDMDSLYTSETIEDIRHWMVHRLINASLSQRQSRKRQQSSMESIPINYISPNVLDIERSVPICETLNQLQGSVFYAIRRLAHRRKGGFVEVKTKEEVHSKHTTCLVTPTSCLKPLNQGRPI